jgi:hypothetical protein
VQEQLERYYLENNRFESQQFSPSGPPARPSEFARAVTPFQSHFPQPAPAPARSSKPVGAVARVQRQTNYRLGAVLVKRCRSLSGWLGMPGAMLREVRAIRKERSSRKNEKLPPLGSYSDAAKAERLKQDLSYRWGRALVKHGRTPWGWPVLPFALHRELRRFRRWYDMDQINGRVEKAFQRVDGRIKGTETLLGRELSKVTQHLDKRASAGNEALARATEQFRATHELWAKERGELTQARDAARAEARGLAEQLKVAQEDWAKERGQAQQRMVEQLKILQEGWAKERGGLAQARDTARGEAQKVTEQLRVAREGWTKEAAALIGSRDESACQVGEQQVQIRTLEQQVRDMVGQERQVQQSLRSELANAQGQLEVLRQLLLPGSNR